MLGETVGLTAAAIQKSKHSTIVQLGVQRVKDVLHPRLDLLQRGVDEVLEDGQRGQPDVVVDTRQPQQQPA